MANKKITQLTELAVSPAGGDKVPLVDISDSTDSVNGTTKWVSVDNLLSIHDANDLEGTTLATNVVSSSLTSVGTLTSLAVTGDLTVDTTTLKVDSTNNRVGVGTVSPSYPLEVVNGTQNYLSLGDAGSSNGASAVYFLAASNKTNWLVGSNYNVENGFNITPSTASGGSTFTTPALQILNSGNVGLGVSPSKTLHVKNTTGIAQLRLDYNGNYSEIYADSNIYMQPNGTTCIGFKNGGNTDFYNTSGAVKMSWDATNERLGIGGTPTEKLHVLGGIAKIDGTYVGGSSHTDWYNITLQNSHGDNSFHLRNIGNTGASDLSLNDKVYITNSGLVGIGTGSPSSELEISGSSTLAKFTGTGTNTYLKITDSASAGGNFIGVTGDTLHFWTDNVKAVTIDGSQNVGIGGTAGSLTGYTNVAINHATNGGMLDFQVAGSRYGSIYNNGTTDFRLGSIASVPLKLFTGTTEALVIDTSQSIDLVASKLTIGGSTGSDGHVLTSDGAGNIAWEAASASATVEGTNVLSAGPEPATKFLRADGDGTCSWQVPSGSGDVVKVGTPADSQVGVWTGDGTIEGTSSLVFDSTGLGIGGTPTSEKLEVIGDNAGGAIATEIYNEDNGDGSVAQLMLSAGALNQTCIVRANSGGADSGLGSYLDMVISNENASTSYGGIVFATSNSSGTLAERVTIDIEGNVNFLTGKVGIATAAPNTSLTIGGDNTISVPTSDGSDNSGLTLTGGGAAGVSRGAFMRVYGNEHATNGGQLRLYGGDISGGSMIFNVNGADVMTIAQAGATAHTLYLKEGNCGIGVTDPASPLHILTNSNAYGLTIQEQTAGAETFSLKVDGGGHLSFEAGVASDLDSKGTVMTLKDDGNVGIGSGATSPTSVLHAADSRANEYLAYIYNSNDNENSHGLNVQTVNTSASCYGLRVNTGGNSNALVAMGSGNVGICKLPTTILDINDHSGTGLRLTRSTVETKLTNSLSQGLIGTVSDHDFVLRSNATDRLTITSGGQVHSPIKETTDSSGSAASYTIDFDGENLQYLNVSDSGCSEIDLNTTNVGKGKTVTLRLEIAAGGLSLTTGCDALDWEYYGTSNWGYDQGMTGDKFLLKLTCWGASGNAQISAETVSLA